jgi:hypothetical protein
LYNLMIVYVADSWDGTPVEFDQDRVIRGYGSKHLSEKFGSLDSDVVTRLMSFPTLFAYELQTGLDARVGWITKVQTRDSKVRVSYTIEPKLPPISVTELKRLEWDLAIGEWEFNHTHWAIKDVDLLAVLSEAGLVTSISNIRAPVRSAISGPPEPGLAISIRPSVFRLPTEGPQENLVSVMMPFEMKLDDVYKTIRRACETVGMTCQRADDVWEETEVIQDVFSLIYRSRIVVCDFSGRNPNVFYETGIAHTLGKPVIPLVQSDADAPFDLHHHRFIKYHNNGEGLGVLGGKLVARLKTLIR